MTDETGVLDQRSRWGRQGRLRGALATCVLTDPHLHPPSVHTHQKTFPPSLAVEHFLNPNPARSIVTSCMIWQRFNCAPTLIGGMQPVPRILHVPIVLKLIRVNNGAVRAGIPFDVHGLPHLETIRKGSSLELIFPFKRQCSCSGTSLTPQGNLCTKFSPKV